MAPCGIVKSDLITLNGYTGLKLSKFYEARIAWNLLNNLLKVVNLQAKVSIFQEISISEPALPTATQAVKQKRAEIQTRAQNSPVEFSSLKKLNLCKYQF